MQATRLTIGIPCTALLALTGRLDGGGLERFEYRRVVMGSEARIVLYAAGEGQAQAAAAAAFARMDELDLRLSDYRVDGELAELEARAGGTPVPVSEDLFRVLELSASLSRESGGAFDVTVGPLTRLWREARRTGRVPADEEVERARGLVGWQLVELAPGRRTARLARAGMRLDLGAIGKGYACDEALASLRARGIERALVELGGDLTAGGPPPGRAAWLVAAGCGGAEGTRVELRDAAVATSGDSELSLELDGERLSHVLDPRSGEPLADAPCVSIVAPNAALADALASAASVLGPSRSAELLARHPGVRIVLWEGSAAGPAR